VSFKQSPNPASVWGANLIGAMAGGFAEYLTAVWGFQVLWLLAIAFYILAFAFQEKSAGQT
jgi:hypothetical protein